MKALRWTYKIIRSLLVTCLLLAIFVPAILFVALSLPGVQNAARKVAERELTSLLGLEVEVGEVSLAPLSSVTMLNVAVTDTCGVKALEIGRLGAGIDLRELLKGNIRISYAEVMDMKARVYRESMETPLNIQPVIDHLKPKDPNQPPKPYDLAITTVVIRKSELHYDVTSRPMPEQGRFSPDHIAIYDLKADATLPRISNDDIRVDIKRLAFKAENAVTITSLEGVAQITPQRVILDNLSISLPNSNLAFSHLEVPLHTPLRDLRFDMAPRIHVNPVDFKAFAPQLSTLDIPLDLDFQASGTPSDFIINNLTLSSPQMDFRLNLEAEITDITEGTDLATVHLPKFELKADALKAVDAVSKVVSLNPELRDALSHLGNIGADLRGRLAVNAAEAIGKVTTDAGNVDFNLTADIRPTLSVKGHVTTEQINVARLFPERHELPSLDVDGDIAYSDSPRSALFDGTISNLIWKGYAYSDIAANLNLSGDNAEGEIAIDDPNIELYLTAAMNFAKGSETIDLDTDIRNFNPSALRLTDKYPGYTLAANVNARLSGTNADNILGSINLSDTRFLNPSDTNKPALILNNSSVVCTADSLGRNIAITGDVINGTIEGCFSFASLPASFKTIAARINPELFDSRWADAPLPDSRLTAHFEIKPENPLFEFIKLPVSFLTPVNIDASLDGQAGLIGADITAPYIRQKDKLIEGTAVHLDADAIKRTANMSVASILPTKAGPMTLNIDNTALNGRHDTEIEWRVASRPNYGNLRFTTQFERNHTLTTKIDVNPGQIVFNDSVWTVAPSTISVADNRVNINNFKVSHSEQLLSINGQASADTTDVITLRLRDINLDYVFETLNIPNVMFGGDATGTFYASDLFSKAPVAYTDNLKVKNISYNGCVMGNAVIESAYRPQQGDITIDAVITGDEGRKSYINGSIHPTKELLDFKFKADKAPVGFLQPFMAAFCDKISGYASGDAHLFGTFKLLDMTGDIFGEDLALHLDFTNTTYHATDSVHITPGLIKLDNIVITDDFGKTALLSGTVTHKDFKEPRFNFRVTDAHDFLAYDIKENAEHPWCGKVFGTGSVAIVGEPGIVNINVDMATGAGTEFAFVLSDAEVANDYNFLTFRDVTPPEARPKAEPDSLKEPAIVTALRNRIKLQNQASPTAYAMTFNIEVTPLAAVTLVMDPVGGDKIKATGSGNLRMSYDSSSEELKMFGTYTLDRGSYNFTLQDIILKDFTIDRGSSIAFHGDPYSAVLDIKAYYALNANLSDLDESFLQDRDLNRTNVPVHAVMKVTGDMRSPDISFDLEFPTLTQDVHRKVRSIISTEDMMNRQIIYLLALNRFYTPDYVAATRGNELMSVASSTISSQLSNMLGQLSDKVSIAPSFRSDRGDFSDVEVDVALSSHLLNNRLLLNGNFGYRDKSLNKNAFIGDFDIEYLLNRTGTIRLKAYNHYNDQNYYIKSALTTQGVGVAFKRDFDNMFNFLRRKPKKQDETTDSVSTP